MIKNFFKSAIRTVVRQKSYTLINILNLSIGMACFILILLWVQSEISINKNFENGDKIFLSHKKVPSGTGYYIDQQVPFPFATLMNKKIPEIEMITRVHNWPTLVEYGDKHFDEYDAAAVDTSFFRIFSYKFIYGNKEIALRGEKNIVITDETAKRYFGDDDPLNKIISLKRGGQYVVSGVVENPQTETYFDFNMFIPIDPLYRNKEEYTDWYSHFLQTYIYVPSATNIDSLDNRMTRAFQNEIQESETDNTRVVEIKNLAYSDLHLYNLERKNQRIQYVYIFSLVALLILIVACINYMNIATSISVKRSREIGLKKVVGAHRKHLSFQFYAESFLQVFIAMLISMMLVELFRPLFNEISGKEILIPYLSNWFIPILFIIILLTSIMAGSYPALLMSSYKPVDAFRGTKKTGKGQDNFRKALVIFQFSISTALIISTMFIYLQLNYINNKDLGFDKENILFEYSNDNINEKYDSFRSELLANPNVVSVCRGSQLPNDISYGMRGLRWVGKEGDDLATFNFASVDEDYIETFGIKIKEGRDFSREFSTDGNHYVMNEAAIKMMNYENPVGRQFQSGDTTGRILGVVNDFNSRPLTKSISPMFFFMVEQYYVYVMIKIRPENKNETIEFINNLWNSYAPKYPFETRFFEDGISRQYRNEIRNSKLALIFTIIIIIITSIGLFGLASHTAQNKTKEIGIRKVFGASSQGMAYMFVKIFIKWVLIANVIAWPLAYYFVNNWLSNYAYSIDVDIWVFVASAILAIMIAIITVAYQSFRAANRNPIESIRYE